MYYSANRKFANSVNQEIYKNQLPILLLLNESNGTIEMLMFLNETTDYFSINNDEITGLCRDYAKGKYNCSFEKFFLQNTILSNLSIEKFINADKQHNKKDEDDEISYEIFRDVYNSSKDRYVVSLSDDGVAYLGASGFKVPVSPITHTNIEKAKKELDALYDLWHNNMKK